MRDDAKGTGEEAREGAQGAIELSAWTPPRGFVFDLSKKLGDASTVDELLDVAAARPGDTFEVPYELTSDVFHRPAIGKISKRIKTDPTFPDHIGFYAVRGDGVWRAVTLDSEERRTGYIPSRDDFRYSALALAYARGEATPEALWEVEETLASQSWNDAAREQALEPERKLMESGLAYLPSEGMVIEDKDGVLKVDIDLFDPAEAADVMELGLNYQVMDDGIPPESITLSKADIEKLPTAHQLFCHDLLAAISRADAAHEAYFGKEEALKAARDLIERDDKAREAAAAAREAEEARERDYAGRRDDGESFPYIACYGYDKESGTWSQGHYSENLTDAKEEYARLTGSDLVAVKAGQSFAVVHGAELAGIGLEDTHQRVSLGGRTRELFRGKTYEDSRKIDAVLDSHDELSIADHLVDGPVPKKDAPEAGGRELSEKARADAREAMGLAACEADRISAEEALAAGDEKGLADLAAALRAEAQATAAGTGEAPRQDPAPGGDAR